MKEGLLEIKNTLVDSDLKQLVNNFIIKYSHTPNFRLNVPFLLVREHCLGYGEVDSGVGLH